MGTDAGTNQSVWAARLMIIGTNTVVHSLSYCLLLNLPFLLLSPLLFLPASPSFCSPSVLPPIVANVHLPSTVGCNLKVLAWPRKENLEEMLG